MEKLLLKLASQLDSIDQASLDALWDKYAQIVNNFEPTKRWEEAVLVLSFIQAKNWKINFSTPNGQCVPKFLPS